MGAIVLVSGGLDSATTLAIALDAGYECYALFFRYGQRHSKEEKSAEKICRCYSVPLTKIEIPYPHTPHSSLIDKNMALPSNRDVGKMTDIPSTYVPSRNLIFLSYASAYCELWGVNDIFLGVNAMDYSGYPDCRPNFIEAFEKALNFGTKIGLEKGLSIHVPLMTFRKAEIVRIGMELGVPYHFTWSCYTGGRYACGVCDSCILRLKGFREAGYKDPLVYRKRVSKEVQKSEEDAA